MAVKMNAGESPFHPGPVQSFTREHIHLSAVNNPTATRCIVTGREPVATTALVDDVTCPACRALIRMAIEGDR
jgi:hypothetical protein